VVAPPPRAEGGGMIASRLGVAIAAGLALVLAIVLAIDLGRTPEPSARALVPGFDAAQVTALAWARDGEPAIRIERVPGSGSATWRWTAPITAPADASTVEATLAALRGARWHRRERAGSAGIARATLTITRGSATTRIDVGAPLEGSAQTWVVLDGRALLVDDWVARALAPAPLALRVARPFADAASARAIELVREAPPLARRLEGFPRRLAGPAGFVLAPEVATDVHRALAGLALTGLPAAAVEGASRLAIALEPATGPRVTIDVRERGCTPPDVAISGSLGDGCAGIDQVAAIERALADLARPATELVDRRALPFEPASLVLPDGAVLDLAGRPKLGDAPADPALVSELVLALATPVTQVVESASTIAPLGTITAADRAGTTLVLELLPGERIRRRGEPVALVPGPGAWAILRRPSTALRDPTLWREEPTTIRTISIDRTTYTRGAVVGEWTRSGPGRDDPAAVTELAANLALGRARPLPATPRVRHRVTFEVAPPTGAPVTRTLELGARRGAGCEAIVDGTPVLFEPELCDLVARLAR